MQGGFAMLEVGSVRAKNAQNILLKNLFDICVGAVFWFLCGYAFSSNDGEGKRTPGGLVGTGGFLGAAFDEA